MPKSHCHLAAGSHSWGVDGPYALQFTPVPTTLYCLTYPHFPPLVIHLTRQEFESVTSIWSQCVSYRGDGRKVEANRFVLLFFI